MNVTPRLTLDGELRTIPATDFLVIECEVSSPPSAKGKTVYACFDVETTTKLVIAAREAAIHHRSVTAT